MKDNHIGAIFAALGALSWSFAGVLSKWLPWNAFTINGLRSLVAVLLLALARGSFKVKLSRGNCLGALSVMLTSVLYMAALKLTTSANAIVLQYAAPAFVILFCWIADKKRPSARSLVSAALIMLGVVLCFADRMGGGKLMGNVLAILSAVTFAGVFFCAKMPDTRPEDYSYLGLILCVPGALFAIGDENFSFAPMQWIAVVTLGACLAGGYFFVSKAMGRVSPVFAVLISNLEPVTNPIWVALFLPRLGEVPGGTALVGSAVVLVTAAVYSLTEDASA